MIPAADFIRRLEGLVLGGVGPGMPRCEEDRHVLLKAVSLGLGNGLPCSEKELGIAQSRWLAMAGPRVVVDPGSLRRALVDFGYLDRDPAGQIYSRAGASVTTFDPEVDALAPLDVIAAARQRLRNKAEGRCPLG